MKKNRSTKLIYTLGVCGLALGAIAPAIPVTSNLAQSVQVASAAENTNSLTIHKYEAPTTELAHDGSDVTSSITNKPLANISFKVTVVTLKTGKKWSDAFDVTTHVLNKDAVTMGTPQTVTTDATGSASLKNLADGVYYVEELPNATVEEPAAPFLVQLPLTNGTQKELHDVNVYPKNTSSKTDLPMTKTLDDSTVGDVNDKEVSWSLNSFVPAAAYQPATADTPEIYSKEYSLIDPLDPALTYVAPITGSFSDVQGGEGTAFDAADFTVDTTTLSSTTGGQVIYIKLTSSGLKKAAGKYVSFKVNTSVDSSKLVIGDDGLYKPVVNSFQTHYDPNGSNPIDPTKPIDPTDPTAPHTPTDPTDPTTPDIKYGRIDILKTEDDADETPLADAEFKLVLKSSEDFAADQAANGYVQGSLDANGNMVAGSSDLTVKSGSDGKIFINGLDNDKEYWLVETQAPKGFEAVKPFAVKAAYDTILDGKIKDPSDIVSEYLPLTGGQLRVILMVAGSLMIIGTGTALYFKKRKENAAE